MLAPFFGIIHTTLLLSIKKAHIAVGFAPPVGLEPTTYWLTASRSNLLS